MRLHGLVNIIISYFSSKLIEIYALSLFCKYSCTKKELSASGWVREDTSENCVVKQLSVSKLNCVEST